MIALARALVWLRWRLAWNGAVSAVRKDTLERLLRMAQGLVPVLVVVAVVPIAAAMAGLGAVLGFRLAAGERWMIGLVAGRIALLVATLAGALSGIGVAAGTAGGGARLALLPIPRRVLFAAQVAAALADVWFLMVMPLPLFVPLGLLARGRVADAVGALLAAVLVAATFAFLAVAASSLAQLVLRHRRMGEWAAIGGMLLIVGFSVVPMTVVDRESDAVEPRVARAFAVVAPWVLPSESWAAAIDGIRTRDAARAVLALGSAGLVGLAMAGLGWWAFGRLMEQPETGGGNRGRARMDPPGRPLPFVARGASVVAEVTARTALRTVRGRFAIYSAPVMGIVMAFAFAEIPLASGYKAYLGPGIAFFVLVLALLALHALQLNQFAIDGPGLVLQSLAPLSARDAVVGKALAWAALSAVVALAAVGAVALLVPRGPAAAWIGVGLAAMAILALQAPGAAAIASVMARPGDPNTMGSAGNAHPLAVLMAMPVVSAAAGPIGLAVAFGHLSGRPWTGTALAAGWAAVCVALGVVLLRPATWLFERRREAILMAAEGR